MLTTDVTIDTPKGSPYKYHYEEATGIYRLKRILPAGMVFPYDFGFIRGTRGEDGDALDVVVLGEHASFPGCVVCCRILGGIAADQSPETSKESMIRNDRFVGVPDMSVQYERIKSIDELPEGLIDELEQFFVNYNKLRGRVFRLLGRFGPNQAESIIQ